jgi:hypothetical protein
MAKLLSKPFAQRMVVTPAMDFSRFYKKNDGKRGMPKADFKTYTLE